MDEVELLDTITRRANLPLLHWPWHDYAMIDIYKSGYSAAMFEGLLKKAVDFGVEFVTVGDVARRIASFHEAELDVEQRDKESLYVAVSATDTASFALQLPEDKNIAAVEDWYAYDGNQVFLAEESGEFNIKLGKQAEAVTRISALPARSRLLTVDGDGTNLEFSLYGEGKVEITPKCTDGSFRIHNENVRHDVDKGKLYLYFDNLQDYPEVSVEVTC